MSKLLVLALLAGLLFRRLLFRAPPPSLEELRAPWVFLLAALAEGALALLALGGHLPGRAAGPWGQGAAYALLLVGFALNLRLPGMPLAALGALLNALAVLANGGHMPVFPWALEAAGLGGYRPLLEGAGDGAHLLVEGEAPLGFLGDWIPLPGVVLSPGDLLILLGVFLLAGVPRRKTSGDPERG